MTDPPIRAKHNYRDPFLIGAQKRVRSPLIPTICSASILRPPRHWETQSQLIEQTRAAGHRVLRKDRQRCRLSRLALAVSAVHISAPSSEAATDVGL